LGGWGLQKNYQKFLKGFKPSVERVRKISDGSNPLASSSGCGLDRDLPPSFSFKTASKEKYLVTPRGTEL